MARKLNKRPASESKQAALITTTAIYIRVSTEKQVDEGFSLESQAKRLRAYCEAHGWEATTAHTYVDAGVSGKSTDRTQFQAMVQAAKAGTINRIVAMKLDRLARNVKDFLTLVEELKGVGCDLVLIAENFDTGTPQGKFALTMFAALAELEASTITERVMSGKVQKAQQGGYNGARCPFGYMYDNGAFTVNGDQAAVVKRIFQEFNGGASMSSIAQALQATNTPTQRGGQWHTATVRYVLSNGFYAGLSQWDGAEVEGSHPAIIEHAVYEAASTRLQFIKPGPEAKVA